MFRQPIPYRSDLSGQVDIERDFVVVDDDIVEETFEVKGGPHLSLNQKQIYV